MWLWTAAVPVLLLAAAIWFLTPVPLPKVTGSTQIMANVYTFSPLATDGSRLYFARYSPTAPRLPKCQ